MDTTMQDVRRDKRQSGKLASGINVNRPERMLSTAVGGALVGLGIGSGSVMRGLALAGLGVAVAYRGFAGHSYVYQALGIDTSGRSPNEQSIPTDEGGRSEERGRSRSTAHQLAAKNLVDKDRFDKLKATQVDRGRDEDKTIEIAAEEVKELRRREGRSKGGEDAYLEQEPT